MEKAFEELDYCVTPLGELILRKRKIPMLEDEIVYEMILNGEFLMSSLFHAVEDALADLGLAAASSSWGHWMWSLVDWGWATLHRPP